MKENIIDRLRTKEDEIEALLAEARARAAAIREEAAKKAASIKAEAMRTIEEEIKARRDEAGREAEGEVARIGEKARAASDEVARGAEGRMEQAIEAAARFIIEGG